MSRKKEFTEKLAGLVRSIGSEPSFGRGSKHPKVMFEIDGRKFSYSYGGSYSDYRSEKNQLSHFRRYLRTLQENHSD
jgi:hypothetical protein